MAPRDPEETSKMIRLEKAGVGIQGVAGVALLVLIALVSDVRGSIREISARVETALRDVAVLQSQNLDTHVRELQARVAALEAQGRKNP